MLPAVFGVVDNAGKGCRNAMFYSKLALHASSELHRAHPLDIPTALGQATSRSSTSRVMRRRVNSARSRATESERAESRSRPDHCRTRRPWCAPMCWSTGFVTSGRADSSLQNGATTNRRSRPAQAQRDNAAGVRGHLGGWTAGPSACAPLSPASPKNASRRPPAAAPAISLCFFHPFVTDSRSLRASCLER